MIILALDVASKIGWAAYDTDRPVSAIISGSIRLDGKTPWEKLRSMRSELPKVLKRYQPDFCAIEAPLQFAPQFKKQRKDMLGDGEAVETTINSKTIAQLNWLAGGATMIVMGKNIPCEQVGPKTWQTVIPAGVKGPPKKRVELLCKMLNINSPNMDSRDAAIMAVWAAGHSQTLKLAKREHVA